jgi:hypothetical protein
LFANRKRRSEVIDELTRERYGHLRGKFFKAPKDDSRFRAVDEYTTLYICGVYAESNFVMSDEAYVCIACRYISLSYQLDGDKKILRGFETYSQSFRFTPADNLDEILAPLYISEEKAAKEVSAMYDEFIKNFLKKW